MLIMSMGGMGSGMPTPVELMNRGKPPVQNATQAATPSDVLRTMTVQSVTAPRLISIDPGSVPSAGGGSKLPWIIGAMALGGAGYLFLRRS